jgi:hypothetical protein
LPGAILPPDQGQAYIYWSTAEQPAYVPTLAEADKRVTERWLLKHARKYAKEEADKLAAVVRKTNGDGRPVLLDAAAKHPKWGHVIELDHVAPLVQDPVAVQSDTGRPFTAYNENRIPVDYASPEMVRKLLDLKKPGETVVLHDKPEATYYVVVLERRDAPDELSFYKAYSTDTDRAELTNRLEQESQSARKFHDAVLEELRREAGYSIDPSYKDRLEEQRKKKK